MKTIVTKELVVKLNGQLAMTATRGTKDVLVKSDGHKVALKEGKAFAAKIAAVKAARRQQRAIKGVVRNVYSPLATATADLAAAMESLVAFTSELSKLQASMVRASRKAHKAARRVDVVVPKKHHSNRAGKAARAAAKHAAYQAARQTAHKAAVKAARIHDAELLHTWNVAVTRTGDATANNRRRINAAMEFHRFHIEALKAYDEKMAKLVADGCHEATYKLVPHFPYLTAADIGINPIETKVESIEVEGYEVAVAGDNIGSSLSDSRKLFEENFLKTKLAEKRFDSKLRKACKEAIEAGNIERVVAIAKKATRDSHAYGKATIDAKLDKRQVQYQKFTLSGGIVRKSKQIYGDMSTTSFGMNKLTEKYFEYAPKLGNVAAYNLGTVRLFNNVMEKRPFTKEMLLVDASALKDELNVEIAEGIKKNFLMVKYVPTEKKAYALLHEQIKKLDCWLVIEIGAGATCARISKGKDGNMPEDVQEILDMDGELRRYGMIYAGPGNQRKGNYILFRVRDNETREAFLARMHRTFDDLTGGLFTTLEEMVKVRGSVGAEDMFKYTSRASLAFTPSTKTFGIKSFAYYHGKLGSGYGDGQWLIDANMMTDYFGLPLECVLGLGLQARILNGIINKGMAIPVSHMDMACTLSIYKKKVQLSHKKFRELWIAGKLEKGVMYLVGGKCPQAVIDKNSMKVVTSTPEDGKFYLRIMSVKAPTQSKLNIQDAVAIQHLDGAPEFIYELGKAHIDKKLDDIERILAGKLKGEIELDETEKEQLDFLGIDLGTRHVVNPDQYYPSLIADICPAFVAHDKGLFQNVVKQVAKSLTKDISRFNFELPGNYRYLQADYAGMIWGKGILPAGKVYMPGLPAGVRVNLTRNPKADKFENYMAYNMSLAEILALIEKSDMSDSIKGVVSRMFINADNSLIITPDDDRVTNSLGGSDYDGDGSTSHIGRYCDIQAQESIGSNTIPKADPSGRVVTEYNMEVAQSMFIAGLYGQVGKDGKRLLPTPIGIIANHATLITALINSDDKFLQTVLDVVVKSAIQVLGYESNGQPYERKFTKLDVEITDEMVVEATEEFYRSDLSLQSFKNALLDASREGASVEGRGIDQNKTGEEVHTGYLGVLEAKDLNGCSIKMKGAMRCKAFDTLTIKEQFEEDENGNVVMSTDFAEKPGDTTLLVKSKISMVRMNLAAYLVSRINEYLALDIQPGDVEKTLEGFNDAEKVNHNMLKMAAYINTFISGNTDIVSEDDASLATEEKNEMFRYLANTVRMAFDKDATPDEKFTQIRNAAYHTKKDRYSSFEYVLREEFVLGVLYLAEMEDWAVNDTIGYKAEVLDDRFISDGEEIYFVNGTTEAGEHIVTNRKVNGFWTMKQIGSAWYATKTAAEYFVVPEVDDKLMLLTKSYDASKKVSAGNPHIDVTKLDGKNIHFTTRVKRGIVGMPESKTEGLEWDFYTPWHDTMTRDDGRRKIVRSPILDWAHDGGVMNVTRIMQGPDTNKKAKGSERTIVYGHISQGKKVQQPELKMDGNIEVNLH